MAARLGQRSPPRAPGPAAAAAAAPGPAAAPATEAGTAPAPRRGTDVAGGGRGASAATPPSGTPPAGTALLRGSCPPQAPGVCYSRRRCSAGDAQLSAPAVTARPQTWSLRAKCAPKSNLNPLGRDYCLRAACPSGSQHGSKAVPVSLKSSELLLDIQARDSPARRAWVNPTLSSSDCPGHRSPPGAEPAPAQRDPSRSGVSREPSLRPHGHLGLRLGSTNTSPAVPPAERGSVHNE